MTRRAQLAGDPDFATGYSITLEKPLQVLELKCPHPQGRIPTNQCGLLNHMERMQECPL